MKIQILLLVAVAILFGGTQMIAAQTKQPMKIKTNEQKAVENTDLKIKFISVIEDSRCPEGVNCIWAGNAKIKIEVSCNNNNKEEFEINTNLGAKGASFDGYAINLTDLSPLPKEGETTDKDSYVATFEVKRLTR